MPPHFICVATLRAATREIHASWRCFVVAGHLARQPAFTRSALTRGTRHHCDSKNWRQFLFTDARCRHDIACCCYGFLFSQSLHCPPAAAADTLSCFFCGVRRSVVWVCMLVCGSGCGRVDMYSVVCCLLFNSVLYVLWVVAGAWGREDGGEI